MLYGLTFVRKHPVYRLHEAFGYFLDEGLKLEKFSSKCFPEWFKPVLSASPSLRSHCVNVHSESWKHDEAIRDSILAVWKSHDQIQSLCEDTTCKLEDWNFRSPQLIHALHALFDFLYEQTLESKAFEKAAGRSMVDHYNSFRALGQRVCPFCGLNYYADRDSGARASYDHFLPRSHYPLASVNFRNLVPMCDECNERPRKGTKDVLYEDQARKTRRSFYYPYSSPGGVAITVECTKRPQPAVPSGAWEVQTKALKATEQPLVAGWNSVFEAEKRFAARVREGLDGWMKNFLNSKEYAAAPTVDQLRRDLSAKSAWLSKPEQLPLQAEAAIQAAAFRYVANDASDEVVAGYAAIARSAAVVEIPSALNQN